MPIALQCILITSICYIHGPVTAFVLLRFGTSQSTAKYSGTAISTTNPSTIRSVNHRLSCSHKEIQSTACLNDGKCFAVVTGFDERSAHCACTWMYMGHQCEIINLYLVFRPPNAPLSLSPKSTIHSAVSDLGQHKTRSTTVNAAFRSTLSSSVSTETTTLSPITNNHKPHL